MNQAVTIESCIGHDAYGAPTFGPAVTYRGRICSQQRNVQTDRGEETVSGTTIYLDTRAAIDVNDRVTLPTGYSPQKPRILKVHRVEGARGTHHVVLYC